MAVIQTSVSDITTLDVDAIVNAANEGLLGGGGVDGAIHRGAGPRLLEACRAIEEIRAGVRCPTGEVRITPGFDLPAKYVIHAVGPRWRRGQSGEEAMLRACYRNAMALASDFDCASIAFPAISCGIYAYPVSLACEAALNEIERGLTIYTGIERVVLTCFDAEVLEAYTRLLA